MWNETLETTYITDGSTDSELVQRFKTGDEKAFTEIVRRYQKQLIQIAIAVIGDENEALDMVQETFIKVYFNLKTFREESSLYTWMYRILYNQCISTLRRKKILSFFSLDSYEVLDIPSKWPQPGEACENNEIRAAVNNALKKLPLKQRMVFVMKQVDGLKHEEIAHIMGVTVGAVKASYFHAVQKLRVLLANHGGEGRLV